MALDFELRTLVHYGLHFLFPLLLALVFYRKEWKKAYGLLLLTMLVDLDHLFATPIFDPHRGSIGFHLLHSYPLIGLYFLGLVLGRGWTRWVFFGLLLHMATDFQDYYFWK